MMGARVEHYGQHGPKCFPCKLKTINFGAMQPAQMNGKDRWTNDPVKQRIEELHNITIDTDHLDQRSASLKSSTQ